LKANLAKKRPVLASANVVALLAGGLAILAGVRKLTESFVTKTVILRLCSPFSFRSVLFSTVID